MKGIDLEIFSRLVSEKTGQKIVFNKIEKIGGGYHSDAFKLTAKGGKSYFLKYVRSHDLGFEFPERRLASLMISSSMSKRAGVQPQSLGVIVTDEKGETILPDLDESSKIYQLQEFAGSGVSYSDIIKKNINKKTIDQEDKKQLSLIADALIKIHSVRHPSKEAEKLKAVYADALRNILANPELSLMVLSEFAADYPILDLAGQKELIGLMYENIKARFGDYRRLTALHGDFWGANIFFRDDGGIFIIDFSRLPWGDPGLDVGWFIAEFLSYYHFTGNNYFRELIDAWFDIYERKSGDKDIKKYVPLTVAWTGIVRVYPRWFPDLPAGPAKKYLKHIKEILKQKEFIWND